MTVHYDDLDINRNIVLDLPFREGAGAITHSVAKLSPLVSIVGLPGPWSTLDSHLPFLTLDGATEYLWASAADTVNLNFTSQDYSFGGWFRIDSGGDDNPTLMSRFLVSVDGWELYHYTTLTLQMRHHHASQGVGNERTSAYSAGWAFNTWYLMCFSRIGAVGQFYQGSIDGFAALDTICNGGLVDPDTCNRNLYIGREAVPSSNSLKGGLWRPRAWNGRALTEADWRWVFERELRWFRS